MEYEDELERMRQRRRRQKAQEQTNSSERGVRQSSGSRRQGRRRPDHPPMEESGDYGRRGRSSSDYHSKNGSGRRHPEDYEYGRDSRRNDGRRREYDRKYDDGSGYDEYDDYDGYNDRDVYEDDGAYDDYDDYRDYDDDEGYDRDYDDYDVPMERGRGRRSDRRGQGGHSRKSRALQDGDRESGGKQPKKKKHRFRLLKLLLLLILVTAGYFIYKYKQTGSGYWTIAVFGVDSRNGNLEKGALSDVEMICVIDRGTGDIKLVSVYRDTYMEINPDGTYHKINEAYFKGGHQQAVQALERNLDLAIDDYATFNWKAVVDAVNILGGIDLEISDSEFKYINSFITETVESTGIGSHHLEHAGMNHLDGVQAVAYARLRLMDTDYNRTARQRLVIQLAMNKAKEADFKTLSMLVKTIIPQISTSIGVDDLLPLARNIRKYHISQNGGFPFSRGETHVGKKDCVIPLTLESNVIQLHQFLYGTENFQPSETVRQISGKIAADSGMGHVAENAPEAKVLGQKALEGGGDNSGGSNGGAANVPETAAPPAQTQAPPPQTAPDQTQAEVYESSQETAPESLDETGEPDTSAGQDEPASSDSQPETSLVQPSEETEAGPGNSGQPETETEIGPGFTQPAVPEQPSEPAAEKPTEETAEVGPGVS